MIQMDIRSRTKNPTPTQTPSVVRNPSQTPSKNLDSLRLRLRSPADQLVYVTMVWRCQAMQIITP